MKNFFKGPVLLLLTLMGLGYFGKGFYDSWEINSANRATFSDVWYWAPDLTEPEIAE